MKASINDSEKRGKFGRAIVYLQKSPLDKVADEWFTKNDISRLNFKCKTWDKVCRIVNKAQADLLKELFSEGVKSITYSRKAGCGCGCSPGFVVKYDNNNVSGRWFWVDLEATEEELNVYRNKVNSDSISKSLALELEENGCKIEA